MLITGPCLWLHRDPFMFQTFLIGVLSGWFCPLYADHFIVMISCITFEGDVYSEEILFLTGLLPREVTWRFFLPYWGTHSCTTSKAAFPCCPASSFAWCALYIFFIGGWRWRQWLVRLRWNRRAERCSGWTLLHAHRRDLWTQRKWAGHCFDVTHARVGEF